jgi:hypothetical protein
VRVFDVMHDILVGKPKAAPQTTSPKEEVSDQVLSEKRKRA